MPVLTNPKHELFAQELAKGSTAEAAYAKAGYTPSLKNAQRLKSNEGIRSRVEEILSQAAQKAGVTVERIAEELVKIGFSDIRKAVRWHSARITEEDNPDGGDVLVIKNIVTNTVEIIASDEIDDNTAAAIAEVSQNEKGGVKIKFHDKLSALEKLGKFVGMFKDRLELSSDGSVEFKTIYESRPRD
ncbi:MAG: terminase small subunit [Methylocella sp.]